MYIILYIILNVTQRTKNGVGPENEDRVSLFCHLKSKFCSKMMTEISVLGYTCANGMFGCLCKSYRSIYCVPYVE